MVGSWEFSAKGLPRPGQKTAYSCELLKSKGQPWLHPGQRDLLWGWEWEETLWGSGNLRFAESEGDSSIMHWFHKDPNLGHWGVIEFYVQLNPFCSVFSPDFSASEELLCFSASHELRPGLHETNSL